MATQMSGGGQCNVRVREREGGGEDNRWDVVKRGGCEDCRCLGYLEVVEGG